MLRHFPAALAFSLALTVHATAVEHAQAPGISKDGHSFVTPDGRPFFWLGDTGWLLFSKLTREESETYLQTRARQGFNVVQVMVLHSLDAENAYGDRALSDGDLARPLTSPGHDFSDPDAYDFWDHVDHVVDYAAMHGITMAMVPVWGSNVKDGGVSVAQAGRYGRFLGERYRGKSNVIWLNGGDTFGNESSDVWNALGSALDASDPDHLISFHPRGRMMSSDWFADAPWIDFHLFQSGHRRYDQDDSERHYGEDNWRYAGDDWQRVPPKPTLDGEPSYEGIPQGLHDPTEPLWDAAAARRYAYWSVFSGSAGHTYGHNAIMQMHREQDGKVGAYGNTRTWTEALHDPGAEQMHHLKDLMSGFPFLDRTPAPELVANQGERHEHLAAIRGKDHALVYTFTGRDIELRPATLGARKLRARWFDPRTGRFTTIGEVPGSGTLRFDPPGEPESGNDWVLALDALP